MANDTLGWIGAGKMGGPMSRRLVEAGHRVVVLEPDEQNRSARRRRPAPRWRPTSATLARRGRDRLLDDPQRRRARADLVDGDAAWPR